MHPDKHFDAVVLAPKNYFIFTCRQREALDVLCAQASWMAALQRALRLNLRQELTAWTLVGRRLVRRVMAHTVLRKSALLDAMKLKGKPKKANFSCTDRVHSLWATDRQEVAPQMIRCSGKLASSDKSARWSHNFNWGQKYALSMDLTARGSELLCVYQWMFVRGIKSNTGHQYEASSTPCDVSSNPL
jgi:hypothetical protein